MKLVALVPALLLMIGRLCLAQHCAPLSESYLSEISAKHVNEALKIRGEYMKRGGQEKEKYQVYVLAYLVQDAGKIPAAAPAALIDPERVLTLHTQLIERNKDGGYPFEYQIETKELAQQLRKLTPPVKPDAAAKAKSDTLRARIRFAIFVPWLEDKTYATLAGLPEDKHECNYANSKALLFHELPYLFDIVHAEGFPTHVSINSDQQTPVMGK